jgi:hypothetical protein
MGRPHAGREHWERLVIAEAAGIDMAGAAAGRHAADATVIDGRRPLEWWIHGWRILHGWGPVQRRIVDGRRKAEQRP